MLRTRRHKPAVQDQGQTASLPIGEGVVFLLLAATIWIAHYWHVLSFGLYEDDWFRIGRIVHASSRELWEILLEGGGQGRPLHDGFIYVFSYLGMKLGGLAAVYGIGYAIAVSNAMLFYLLLKRLSDQPVFWWSGALVFALFPADSTDVLLTHSLGIQPSLLLLLGAFHAYLSDRIFWAYLLSLLTLFCYETFFPVFFVAPLLKQISRPKGTKRARLFPHAVIMVLIFLSVILLRKLVLGGMGVAGQLGISEVVAMAAHQMLIGSMVSMAMLFYRPVQALLLASGPMILGMLLFCLALTLALALRRSSDHDGLWVRFPDQRKLAVAGLCMLLLVYPLTFTVPASMISGRESRVHAAAVVGASILVACAITALWSIAGKRHFGRLARFCTATYLCLLVGFGWVVQADYVTSWQYQQAFWRDVVRLCPDLSDGSVVVVESYRRFKRPDQIKAQGWSLPVVLDAIVAFPAHWQSVPRLYQLDKQWKQRIVSDRNEFRLVDAVEWLPFLKPAPQQLYASKDVILLQVEQGRLTRRSEITIEGKGAFPLHPRDHDVLPFLEKTELYERLLGDGQQQPVDYLRS